MTHLRSALIALALGTSAFPGTACAQLGGTIDKRLEAIASTARVQAALNSAAVVVLGRQTDTNEAYAWLVLMNSPAYAMLQQSGEVNYLDAFKFLKAFIARPEGAGARAQLIERAYREVYGIAPSPVAQATWDADVRNGKAWFVTIVTRESASLNASPPARAAMLTTAYQYSHGRPPVQGDLDFWMKKPERYDQVVKAERTWLYTAGGAAELVEVAKRAWKAAYNTTPSDEALKAVLVKATSGKMVYAELAKVL
jgi:hypothetical protein